MAYPLAVLLLAEATRVERARLVKRLASNELGLPMPNASVKIGGSGVNQTRDPYGLSGSSRVGKSTAIASRRRGQESNLQGLIRNLTVFETAGPVTVPTLPWSRRVELNHRFPLMRGTFCR